MLCVSRRIERKKKGLRRLKKICYGRKREGRSVGDEWSISRWRRVGQLRKDISDSTEYMGASSSASGKTCQFELQKSEGGKHWIEW